jgi:two-component system NtrC family sensor kinase
MRWWRLLGVRLAATVLLASAAAMTLFTWLVLDAQQSFLVSRVTYGAGLLSDTIKSATYHAMLEDRRTDAYRSMESIGREQGIERVRFFNKEGRITFSTNEAERGTLVDKRAEACYACHAADRPIERLNVPSRARVYVVNGHRVLAMVTPIYNEPSCSAAPCHAHTPERTVLGVLDIGISLAAVDASIVELRNRTLLISCVAALALTSLVNWFAHRKIVRPVRDLLKATRRIAAGDLSTRVPVRTSTEIGELEQSFNEMGAGLAAARQERDGLLASLERKVEERTAALTRAQDQLVRTEKLSSLGRLAASVAHEINNPLAGILTYAKLLLRTFESKAGADPKLNEAVKYLGLVKRETERCSAIVRNLLDFARERPLKTTDVDLRAVVEDALVLISNQAKLQNVEIQRDLGPVPPVLGDFGQLRQACVNVVINACDAMKQGGTLRITAVQEDDGPVALSFADTGVGIPPEHLRKVLDPFFTTKEKGTGLGLSVVYGILERHGGTVDIASEVGRGTTVTFRLPTAARSPMRHDLQSQRPAPLTAADLGTGALPGGHAS